MSFLDRNLPVLQDDFTNVDDRDYETSEMFRNL